jgi:predicted nucleic acid-binding protein
MAYIVADASSIVPAFFGSELGVKSRTFLTKIRSGQNLSLVVPSIFIPECSNALWFANKQGDLTREEAFFSLRNLVDLNLIRRPEFDDHESILDLAISRSISFYDASYLFLSEKLACPLVSEDRPLLLAAKATIRSFDLNGILALLQ